MHVSRAYHVVERAARYRGIERGSVGTFDACSTGVDRTGLTEKERAGYDFAHDLSARDGFSGFAPGLERELQGAMIASLFGAIAVSFARWSDSVSRCSHPTLPDSSVLASERASWAPAYPIKAADRRAPRQPRGKRKAMIDASEQTHIDGVSLVRLPTGGARERRVTR